MRRGGLAANDKRGKEDVALRVHRREIPPLRPPARSQEANGSKKSRRTPVGMTVFLKHTGGPSGLELVG